VPHPVCLRYAAHLVPGKNIPVAEGEYLSALLVA
jgi:hypothetical protein